MAKITKRQKQILELLEEVEQPCNGAQAIEALKTVSGKVSKFDETLELHMRTGYRSKTR